MSFSDRIEAAQQVTQITVFCQCTVQLVQQTLPFGVAVSSEAAEEQQPLLLLIKLSKLPL